MSEPSLVEEREAPVRKLCQAGQTEDATAAALRLYGREVLSFLVALHRDESSAAEVFSEFSEELWKSLTNFRWQCSLRTFAYTIARRASWRYRRDGRRDPARNVPLSQASVVSKVAADLRSETASYLKADAKSKLAAIREELGPEDGALLVLRIDKQLAWNDVARVLHEGDEEFGEEDVKRESARLRKRFEILKKKLLELGKKHGLVAVKPLGPGGG